LKTARLRQDQLIFSNKPSDALVAYLISAYKNAGRNTLGRTILQKLCYFAEASGVPLSFRFEIYHYGPFSQEIFDTTERLLLDGVIADASENPGQSNYILGSKFNLLLTQFGSTVSQYKRSLTRVAEMFSSLRPSQMELISTIHYMHASHREWFDRVPKKHTVVASVLEVKGGKFNRRTVEEVYDLLRDAKLLS
jgi:hypothetical protein